MIAEDCTSLPRALSEIFSNYQIQGKRKHFCMDLPHSDIAEGFFFFSFILSCSIQKASWHFSCLFFFFFSWLYQKIHRKTEHMFSCYTLCKSEYDKLAQLSFKKLQFSLSPLILLASSLIFSEQQILNGLI